MYLLRTYIKIDKQRRYIAAASFAAATAAAAAAAAAAVACVWVWRLQQLPLKASNGLFLDWGLCIDFVENPKP